MLQFKIFIIEDDPWYGELLKYHLSLNPDYEVKVFGSGKDCLDSLHEKPDVVCIDFGLPDMTGDILFERIRAVNNTIPVVVISGQEEVAVAVNLLKSGISDYIIKDDNSKELLWNAILKIRENAGLRQEVEELKEQLEQKFNFEKSIIGQSNAMKKTFSLIEKAIKTNINVSITGETGTGKELVAKAIHYNSERKKKPFVEVNMAAIPKELIESELLGHEKGSFTGSVARKIGKFEAAHGGTIFLDEIAEMDFNIQNKILRVLQEREVVRIGGNEKIKLDVRLITATHKNLVEEVKNENFREDLYYRIIGLPIELPPLRERGSDILILAKYFSGNFTKTNKMKEIVFSNEAKEKLMKYNFPGNVRELKAIVDLACVMCDGNEIKAKDITYTAIKPDEQFIAAEKTLKEYNCDIIKFFLDKYDNNVLLVANKLDIGKSTIYKMIQQKKFPDKTHVMYGLINKAIEDLVIQKFGENKWEKIKEISGIDIDFFISNETYDDAITYNLVGAISEETKVPVSDLLFAVGEWWILKVSKEKYGALLESGGNSLRDFLVHLPIFHNRVMLIYPKITPPEFRVSDVNDHSIHVHYFSKREGLQDFVNGLLHGLGKLYKIEVEVQLLESRNSGNDHEIFKVSW